MVKADMDVKAVLLDITLFILTGIMVLSTIRIIIGPATEDRLIGLNLVFGNVLAVLVVLAVRQNQALYLDVALVYAILGYIGTLAIARYLKKGEKT